MTVKLEEESAGPGLAGALCAICQTPIRAGERTGPCPACTSPFHVDCWVENGGCATYGCEHMPELVKESAQPTPVFAEATERPCPSCRKPIRTAARRCKHCGVIFELAAQPVGPVGRSQTLSRKPAPSPMSADASGASVERGGEKAARLVLILGFIPCTAPFALLFGGLWYLSQRSARSRLSPTGEADVTLGLAVSAAFTVVGLVVLALS